MNAEILAENKRWRWRPSFHSPSLPPLPPQSYQYSQKTEVILTEIRAHKSPPPYSNSEDEQGKTPSPVLINDSAEEAIMKIKRQWLINSSGTAPPLWSEMPEFVGMTRATRPPHAVVIRVVVMQIVMQQAVVLLVVMLHTVVERVVVMQIVVQQVFILLVVMLHTVVERVIVMQIVVQQAVILLVVILHTVVEQVVVIQIVVRQAVV
jgi:hypothetical protein